MSANINVNLNHCELTPSAEQSVHGEFIWLVNGANTERIMHFILSHFTLWVEGFIIPLCRMTKQRNLNVTITG